MRNISRRKPKPVVPPTPEPASILDSYVATAPSAQNSHGADSKVAHRGETGQAA